LRTVGHIARNAAKKLTPIWSLNFGRFASFDQLPRHSAVFKGGRVVEFRLNFGRCANLLFRGIPVIVFFLLVQRFLLNTFAIYAWCLSQFYVEHHHHNHDEYRP
jgi:hypothetical protein